MNKKQTQPAWVKCDCGEFWCNIHQTHAWECDCPPIEDWPFDPYQSTGASAPSLGETMKVKTTVHIFYSQYSWEDKGEYLVFYAKVDDDESRTYIGAQEIEIDVPDNYDPRAQKIAALEKHKQKVMAEFQKTVDQINERISNLQALEYTA